VWSRRRRSLRRKISVQILPGHAGWLPLFLCDGNFPKSIEAAFVAAVAAVAAVVAVGASAGAVRKSAAVSLRRWGCPAGRSWAGALRLVREE